MKLSEIIKILPAGDTVYVTTEHNERLYEGRALDMEAELTETSKEAEVAMLSPDWQEEIIIVIVL